MVIQYFDPFSRNADELTSFTKKHPFQFLTVEIGKIVDFVGEGKLPFLLFGIRGSSEKNLKFRRIVLIEENLSNTQNLLEAWTEQLSQLDLPTRLSRLNTYSSDAYYLLDDLYPKQKKVTSAETEIDNEFTRRQKPESVGEASS